jgi:regulator of sigma E protease
MNLLTAVVIFFFVYWITGVSDNTNRIGLVKSGTMAAEIGLELGDEIIGLNGQEIDQLDEVFLSLHTDDSTELTVRGKNGERTVNISRRLAEKEDFGILLYYEAKIKSVVPDSPAEKAGIKPGDIIVAIDGQPVVGWEHMRSIVEANPDTRKTFTVRREGSDIDLDVEIGHSMRKDSDGAEEVIGRVGYGLDVPVRKVGPAEATVMAYKNTVFLAVHTFDFFIKLVTGRMSMKLVGGPVMIAQLAGESAQSGFMSLLGFTAFISVNLGVLNLLPFPVFDGGHILILLLEAVSRRKLSEKARIVFQQAGTLFLLLLMIYITFNDIMRFDFVNRLFGSH